MRKRTKFGLFLLVVALLWLLRAFLAWRYLPEMLARVFSKEDFGDWAGSTLAPLLIVWFLTTFGWESSLLEREKRAIRMIFCLMAGMGISLVIGMLYLLGGDNSARFILDSVAVASGVILGAIIYFKKEYSEVSPPPDTDTSRPRRIFG